MKIFKLPDLGEGLQEAEIVSWHVNVGDNVVTDQPLVSVETDKAIVEIPSPQAGRIARVFGGQGDIVRIGAPLVEYETDEASKEDSGAIVGEVEKGQKSIEEQAVASSGAGGAGVRATPAVRALARRLEIDLAVVTPSGKNGVITTGDVERVAKLFKEVGPLKKLTGARRSMARNMTISHSEVVPASLFEDADIHLWQPDQDPSLRLIQAIAKACTVEPELNAWYDHHAIGKRLLEKIDVAVAVNTEEGLFVPVLKDVAHRSGEEIRKGLDRMISDVKARSIPAEEMRGGTITLSNFGPIGGRYAALVVMPPTVAIVGAGKIRDQVVAWQGEARVHKILPISLTFDHRAVTGGEAAGFLDALINELQKPEN